MSLEIPQTIYICNRKWPNRAASQPSKRRKPKKTTKKKTKKKLLGLFMHMKQLAGPCGCVHEVPPPPPQSTYLH